MILNCHTARLERQKDRVRLLSAKKTGPGTEDQVKASVVSLLEKLRLFEMVDFVVLRHGHDIILNRQELGALHRDFYAKGGELALNLDSRLHNLESKFNDMMKVIVWGMGRAYI